MGQQDNARVSDGARRLYPPKAKPAPWLAALQRMLPAQTASTGFEDYEPPTSLPLPKMYAGGDPNATRVRQILAGPQSPQAPPLPGPPPMFSGGGESPATPAATRALSGLVEGEGLPPNWMLRTPGGKGLEGPEWTARQTPGNYQGVGEPMAAQFRRPTEELWKQASRSPEETAPGAQASAGMELFGRVGPSPEQQLKMLDAQIPVRQQEVAGQYGLQQEALKGQYGLRGKQLEQDSLRQGYDTLRQFLGASGEGGIRPGSSVSLTGIGSYRAPQEQRVPQGLLRDLLAARTDWEDSAGTFGSRDEVLGSQYRQALGSVFAQDPSHPETQELAKFIATNPELAELPVQELMQDPRLAEAGWSLDEMTDEDWDDLSRLMNYSRGAAGF